MTSFLRVVNETRQSVLGGRIKLADSMPARMRGFLLRGVPRPGEGLMLVPCKGIHMFGMRFPLDVLLGGREGTVLVIHSNLQPGSRTAIHAGAHFALELPCGTIARSGTVVADRLSWHPVEEVSSGAGGRAQGSATVTLKEAP